MNIKFKMNSSYTIGWGVNWRIRRAECHNDNNWKLLQMQQRSSQFTNNFVGKETSSGFQASYIPTRWPTIQAICTNQISRDNRVRITLATTVEKLRVDKLRSTKLLLVV